jgi:hypothetical protein
MSTLRRRLADIEQQKAFRDWQGGQRLFEGRSRNELLFFGIYGYFPDALEGGLPQKQEFTVGGVRAIITSEWVDKA